MNEVQRINVNANKPFHHIHEAWHKLFVSYNIALNRSQGGATLLASLSVYTTADSVSKTFGEVGTSSKELHFLTGLCSRHTATNRVIITPHRSHHVIILVLDRTGLHRNFRSVVLEAFGQTRRIKNSEVGFRRWTHILERMEEAEVILRYHRAAVLPHSSYLKRCPDRVAREQLVISGNTSKLHHTEFHYQVINQFLCFSFGKGSLIEVALYINVKEC